MFQQAFNIITKYELKKKKKTSKKKKKKMEIFRSFYKKYVLGTHRNCQLIFMERLEKYEYCLVGKKNCSNINVRYHVIMETKKRTTCTNICEQCILSDQSLNTTNILGWVHI